MRQSTPLNLDHFSERARQSGDLQGDKLEPEQFIELNWSGPDFSMRNLDSTDIFYVTKK